jgi:hypothetical protein
VKKFVRKDTDCVSEQSTKKRICGLKKEEMKGARKETL